jgi:hypothetical protein
MPPPGDARHGAGPKVNLRGAGGLGSSDPGSGARFRKCGDRDPQGISGVPRARSRLVPLSCSKPDGAECDTNSEVHSLDGQPAKDALKFTTY